MLYLQRMEYSVVVGARVSDRVPRRAHLFNHTPHSYNTLNPYFYKAQGILPIYKHAKTLPTARTTLSDEKRDWAEAVRATVI